MIKFIEIIENAGDELLFSRDGTSAIVLKGTGAWDEHDVRPVIEKLKKEGKVEKGKNYRVVVTP